MLSSLCGHCLPSCQAERHAPGLLVLLFSIKKKKFKKALNSNEQCQFIQCYYMYLPPKKTAFYVLSYNKLYRNYLESTVREHAESLMVVHVGVNGVAYGGTGGRGGGSDFDCVVSAKLPKHQVNLVTDDHPEGNAVTHGEVTHVRSQHFPHSLHVASESSPHTLVLPGSWLPW